MIHATVKFPADRSLAVDLIDGGWVPRDAGLSPLGGLLDRIASPVGFGPSDGDPAACAADACARFLSGIVTFVREPDPVPADAVF